MGSIHRTRRKLLLAEDNPDDVCIFRHAFEEGYHEYYTLNVVPDGQEALDFLYKRGQWDDAWTPDLFVLNINMPRVNGWEVFKQMREDPQLPTIPTVIWSVASKEDYNVRAYQWGACGIFTKPVDSKDMVRQVQTILDYFLLANPYPRAERMRKPVV